MQHMIQPLIFARLFKRQHVLRVCHDANCLVIPRRIRANRTQFFIRQVLTLGTQMNRVFRGGNRLRELVRVLFGQI